MTEQEWLDEARSNAPQLRDLLREFHPANRQPGRRPTDFITAPGAEAACTQVRKSIRENHEGDPVNQFDEALADNDLHTVWKLLNQAWFGVPESTTCWQIPGFREAVGLLEDLPETEEVME